MYLGNSLPKYAIASISLAKKYSGMNIKLLASRELFANMNLPVGDFIEIDNFYNKRDFEEASKRIVFEHDFRDGFWLKSYERLFVLEQFMIYANLSSILHAELDQLFFGIKDFASSLNNLREHGVFVPFHNPRAAVASILYCNSRKSLTSLVNYSLGDQFFLHEMDLIAKWAGDHSDSAFALPTLATEKIATERILPKNVNLIDSNLIGGVIDAAQIGQWVGGNDPKNVSIWEKPRTKFVDLPQSSLLTFTQLAQLRFNFDSDTTKLTCAIDNDDRIRIYNLHIHSRIHPWLIDKIGNLKELFVLSNKVGSHSIPGSRKTQLFHYFSSKYTFILNNLDKIWMRFQRNLNSILRLRKSSYPFITSDTFRSIADQVFEGDIEIQLNFSTKSTQIVFCESQYLFALSNALNIEYAKQVVLIISGNDLNLIDKKVIQILKKKSLSIHSMIPLADIENINFIPSGIENHSFGKGGKAKFEKLRKLLPEEKDFRVIWDINIYNIDSKNSDFLIPLLRFKLAHRVGIGSTKKLRIAMMRYAFIALPIDRESDIVKIWEAFYLHCVPIVLRNEITEQFHKIGLPIWLVNSYEEILNYSEFDMAKMYKSFSKRFESDALWIDFWISRVMVHQKN